MKSSKAKTALKSLGKRAYLLLFSALLLIAVLVVSGFLLSSPARVVRGYFESFAAGDYETAYAYLSAPDSPFISKEAFGDYMRQELAGNMDVANYVIDRTSFRRLMQTYEVTYILQGESAEDSLRVELVRQRKKQLLFFNRYKVGVGGMVDRSCTVYAPEGIELSVDGIAVPESKNAVSEHAHMSAYTIPAIFRGRHRVAAKGDWFEEIADEWTLEGKSKEKTLFLLEVGEDTRAYLAENAYNVFTALVAGAVKGDKLTDIPGITGILTTNAEALGAMKETYRNLSGHVKSQYDGTGLKSVSFKSFRDDSESVYLDFDGRYVCAVSFNYTYVMQELDYATGKLTEEAFNNEREGAVRCAFAREDGGWRIVALEDYGLYF